MKFNLSIAALFSLVLLVPGCTPATEEPVTEAPTPAEDVAAINALDEEYEAAENAGDAAALAALFAEDAIAMPPNAPAIVGSQAIQAWAQSFYDEAVSQLAMSTAEVEVAGDWAFARGTYTYTTTPKAGGEAIEDNGKYLTIYSREPGGIWRLYRDIYNSDNPVPGTEE